MMYYQSNGKFRESEDGRKRGPEGGGKGVEVIGFN